MDTRPIRIIMNGVTGRMGTNQHLVRSILAIRNQGGILLPDGVVLMPEPVLVGRNPAKLEALSKAHGDLPWTTSLEQALANPENQVYFDAQTTDRRHECVLKAIAAGKHIYCEKPVAETTAQALELHRAAEAAGVRHGVVQDKLWLPGLQDLRYLIDRGFFGRILAVRAEFGYWVFDGKNEPLQRPSWNYRAADGGGIILDMLCHWRYVIDNLFGNVQGLTCLGANHIPERWDENRTPYEADADDACYATLRTDRGAVCQFNSSWCTRVCRDDLLVMQVDGTEGSAVAGLRHVKVQPASATPRPVWNPDIDSAIDYRGGWLPMPSPRAYDNAFKSQWELFLRHIAADLPFRWNLAEGAKGVQLAELAMESWRTGRWLEVPAL